MPDSVPRHSLFLPDKYVVMTNKTKQLRKLLDFGDTDTSTGYVTVSDNSIDELDMLRKKVLMQQRQTAGEYEAKMIKMFEELSKKLGDKYGGFCAIDLQDDSYKTPTKYADIPVLTFNSRSHECEMKYIMRVCYRAEPNFYSSPISFVLDKGHEISSEYIHKGSWPTIFATFLKGYKEYIETHPELIDD